MNAYCFKCKSKNEIENPTPTTRKDGRLATMGTCSICGNKMYKVTKQEQKPEEQKVEVSENIEPLSEVKKAEGEMSVTIEEKLTNKRKPFMKKYWGIVLPIAGLALLGFLLKNR